MFAVSKILPSPGDHTASRVNVGRIGKQWSPICSSYPIIRKKTQDRFGGKLGQLPDPFQVRTLLVGKETSYWSHGQYIAMC